MENSGKIWKKIVNFAKSLRNGQTWTNLEIYFLPRQMKNEKN